MQIKDLTLESRFKLRQFAEYWKLCWNHTDEYTDESFGGLDLNDPIEMGVTRKSFTIPYTNRFLHYAILIGDEALVQELVDKKVDVNQSDLTRKSPLQVASDNGRSGIARILIDNGAITDEVVCDYTSNPCCQPLTFAWEIAWTMKEKAFGRQVNFREMNTLIEQNSASKKRL